MSELSAFQNIIHELIYQRFLISNEKLRKHLTNLTVEQYMTLHIISNKDTEDPIYAGRTYLNDLSVNLNLSIHRTSKIITSLRDKGLVIWSHDGDGSDGTYVLITPEGLKLIESQDAKIKAYYERVINKFGQEKMIKLLQMTKELETIMKSELERTEGSADEY